MCGIISIVLSRIELRLVGSCVGMSSLLTSAIEAMTITNALIVLLIECEREKERKEGES